MKGKKSKREARQTLVWSSLWHLCLHLAWYLPAVPWWWCWHQSVCFWVPSQAHCASFALELDWFQSQMRQSLETVRHLWAEALFHGFSFKLLRLVTFSCINSSAWFVSWLYPAPLGDALQFQVGGKYLLVSHLGLTNLQAIFKSTRILCKLNFDWVFHMFFEGHSNTFLYPWCLQAPQKRTIISGIHTGRIIMEQKSSEGLKQLLQNCSCRRYLKTFFLIWAGLASWCHPNWCSQTRVQVSHPDPVCVHHHHFSSGEETPTGLSEGQLPHCLSLLQVH